MKRTLAIFLTVILSLGMLLPARAAEDVNISQEIPFAENAPIIDGIVSTGEYNTNTPLHSYSENKSQFSDTDDFDTYDNWDVEFYSAYDAENLYMAWVVKSDVHASLPMTDANGDGSFNELDYPYMWQYSCLLFMLVPNHPAFEENYSGNYLEVYLGLVEDGTSALSIQNYPTDIDENDISVNEWNAVVIRDDEASTTTYEIAVPASDFGITAWGSESQFGLSYAVASQENFDVKPGMLEWQDAILGNGGRKQPNNCAVMTLGKSDTNPIYEGSCGKDADWTFYTASKTLIISGTGETDSYIVDNTIINRPWETYTQDILSIVVEDGITHIGDGAFIGCSNVQKIIIPQSVCSMGNSPFSGCISLKDIVIPASVKYLGANIFESCSSLTDIYCEAESQPEGWDEHWLNDEYCPSHDESIVHWGYTPKIGDPNNDGALTAADYLMLKKIVFSSLSTESLKDVQSSFKRCDVTGDGKITAIDYLKLKKMIMA